MQAASPRQRTKKRTKAGILVSSITYTDVEACFALPTEKACVKLGVGLTILKRLCRKFGIQRWPYRSLLKAGKAQRVPNTPTFSDSVPCSPYGATAPSCATPGSGDAKTGRILHQASSSSQTSHIGTVSEGSSRPASSAAATTAPAEMHSPPRAAAMPSPRAAPPPVRTAVAAAQVAAAPVAQPVAQPPKASQLGVLLSAIDVFEAPAARTVQPPTPRDSAGCAPYTPHACAGRGLAAPPAGAAPQRRAFSHSLRSGFRPVARPVQQQQVQQQQQQRSQLLARLAALQSMQAEVTALAPPPPMPDAAARILRTQLASQAMTEGQRLVLAEKLLLVRAALQARISRRAALASVASGGRYSPYPTAPSSTYSAATSGPVSIASLPTNNSGESVGACGLSIADRHALASARSLLAQYRL